VLLIVKFAKVLQFARPAFKAFFPINLEELSNARYALRVALFAQHLVHAKLAIMEII